jgi:hypothetical protein
VFFDQQSPAGTFLRETERMFMHINPGKSAPCPRIPNQLLSERSQLRQNTFTGNEGLIGMHLLAHFLQLSGARCRFFKKSPTGDKDITKWAGFKTKPKVSDFMLFRYHDPNSYITHKTGVRAPVDLIEKTLFWQVQHDGSARGKANGMLYIGSELNLFMREGTGVHHSNHSVVVFPCQRGKDFFIMCNHWGDHKRDKRDGRRPEQDCRTLREQLQGPLLKYELREHYDYWVSRDVYERWLNTVGRDLVDLST